MPRSRDELPAVRVYTVCDESKYLIVRNVTALGCGDELKKQFSGYGDVEECKPMDAEDCEEYTDVFWIKFRLVSNSRFAKRRLDEHVFLGNRLQLSYAPQFESISDTKEKLEGRRREVIARLSTPYICNSPSGVPNKIAVPDCISANEHLTFATPPADAVSPVSNYGPKLHSHGSESSTRYPPLDRVSSDQEYFPSHSMNQTVRFVREKLNKIHSSGQSLQEVPAIKKPRLDNRRRI